MALEHPRLLAASLTVALLGASCSTPTETPEDNGTATPESTGGQPMTGAPGSTGQGPQGQGGIAGERRAALVNHWLDTARKLRMQGTDADLRAAKYELLKAKEIDPLNEQVRNELAAVQAQLGEPVGNITSFGQEQMRLQEIRAQRLRASVENQLQTADQRMSDKDYAGAIEELRRASLAIEVNQDMDWMDLTGRVDAAKGEAERLYDEQQRRTQEQENAVVADQLRRDFERAEARRQARIGEFLRQSELAFNNKQFERSRDYAQRALQEDPSNSAAYELLNASTKGARNKANDTYWANRVKEIRAMLEAHEELKVPQTALLRMDPKTWAAANRRVTSNAAAHVADPQDALLAQTVESVDVGRLTYTEENGDYLTVLKNLEVRTGVPIITTPEARTIIEDESLVLAIETSASMKLKDVLNHMIGRSAGLAWTIRDGVVVVGDQSQAAGTLLTRIYPVKDLIFQLTEFLPPIIEGIPTEEGFGDGYRTGGEGDDPIIRLELGDLETNIKRATGDAYWEREGVSFTPEDSGFITIVADEDMHRKVSKLLNEMRRFQTPSVHIDSKFLTISRNFLQEIGVDFRGLGGSGLKGDTASLDDVTNGLVNNASRGQDNGGTGDPAANPLAGAFFNDGSDGDVRARTENFFLEDLGKVLSPTGGLTAGWTLLDDTQLNMILRAVEKRQDAEIVNSQILSVMDRARGHVAVINQTAYVRDFDVEVAQAAFIADPKIDVVQDGVVLDVKPTIQHDRKYVLLDLNPTVAELERPIPTFTTSLAGSTLPVTIQLPQLTVTRFRTVATVPDGGTLLLGGLRQVLTKERRAEVPLLSRLPLISFLFKQEGTADENKSLVVMIRATITDIANDGVR